MVDYTDIIESTGKVPSANNVDLPISPGDDVPDSLWSRIVNLRVVKEGPFHYWKLRGGSEVKFSLPTGNIVTMHEFVERGTGIHYLVLHSDDGIIFLKNSNSSDAPVAIMTGFTTEEQVQIFHSNNNLYVLDYDKGKRMVYDLKKELSYPFLDYNQSEITGHTLKEASSFKGFEEDNFLGVKEGGRIIVIPKKPRTVDEFRNESAISLRPFMARINSIDGGRIRYRNDELFYTEQVVGFGADEDHFIPYGADLEPVTEEAGRQNYDGTAISFINQYTLKKVYRRYQVLDMLTDGSICLPGKPVYIEFHENQIINDRIVGVNLNISQAGANVSKRFLLASRWQYNLENTFVTTSENYPNGNMFIVDEIPLGQIEHTDKTPDSLLITPSTELIHQVAGVPAIFGSGQLEFNTVASYKGSAIFGGYSINRGVPTFNSNVFENIDEGYPLIADSPRLGYVFEYTDGSRSSYVESATDLTEAEDTVIVENEASATVEFQCTTGPDSGGQVEVRLESDELNPVTVSYAGSDTISDVINAVVTAVNASSLSNRITSSQSGQGTLLLTWDNAGYDGNDESVLLTWSESIDFENNGTGQLTKSFTGGVDELLSTERFNYVQFHNLNALIEKIYITITRGAEVRLLESINKQSSYFASRPLELPVSSAEIDELGTFDINTLGSVKETANLPDHLLIGVPAQDLRIDRQTRLVDGSTIERLLLSDLDTDKTQLRYRLFIFTSSGIHYGYLADTQQALFQDFEVIQESVTLRSKAMTPIGSKVVIQLEDGVYMIDKSSGQMQKIIDRDEYEMEKVTDMLFNKRFNEYWIMLGGSKIVIFDVANDATRIMSYADPVGNIYSGTVLDGRPYLGMGSSVYETDMQSEEFDGVSTNKVVGTAISKYLSSNQAQLKILNARIYGDGYECGLSVDLQRARRIGSGGWFSGFQTDLSYSSKILKQSGAFFKVQRRAVMPRIKLEVVRSEGVLNGFVENVSARTVITENEGISRK